MIDIINIRYTKVIDNIKNIRKEQLINIKLETQKIGFLEKDRFKAESVNILYIIYYIFKLQMSYSMMIIIISITMTF